MGIYYVAKCTLCGRSVYGCCACVHMRVCVCMCVCVCGHSSLGSWRDQSSCILTHIHAIGLRPVCISIFSLLTSIKSSSQYIHTDIYTYAHTHVHDYIYIYVWNVPNNECKITKLSATLWFGHCGHPLLVIAAVLIILIALCADSKKKRECVYARMCVCVCVMSIIFRWKNNFWCNFFATEILLVLKLHFRSSHSA